MQPKTTCFLLFLFLNAAFDLAQSRNVITLRDGWRFAKGPQDQAFQKEYDDSGWEEVTVPHDWAIYGPFDPQGDGNTGKLPWKGEGWYRTRFSLPAADRGKRVYLLCDGIMAFPRIYVNGKLAGQWDYGYSSFYLDLTPHIRFGEENVLAVHADTRPHDSRWYPGAGIYRKVQLIVVNPVHVDIWGAYITTPIIKPHYADVRVATTVRNAQATPSEVRIVQSVVTADGRMVEQAEQTGTVNAQTRETFETTLTLRNPRRWDIDDPYLYTLVTKIYERDRLLDEYTSTFGVRDIRFTPDHGFYLNDRRIQLKGVNLHHDHGPLGAAFNTRAMERQLEIMKAMGCNAVRNSHNVAAPELLDLCDRMGLLVFNEVFDKYDAKAGILDTTDFEHFTKRNIRNFVIRDRNHPSVFLWSVGNEIGPVQWNIDGGFDKLRTMVNYVRKYDLTRPVTLVCDNEKSAALRHFDYYDVHSWNYGRRYKLARQLEPNKAVIISESASTVSTRGFYEFPLPEAKTDFTLSLQVSSYDLNAPNWAEIADDDFMWQQEEPYIAGEFVWTGFDYLGEPTPYASYMLEELGVGEHDDARSSYFGIVDLCGIPKDRYYLYKSYWKPEETTIHILPHWNWEDRPGENVPVFVYTNGDCAELFLNGKSLGKKCKQPKSENSVERFRLMWKDVKYEPGEVRVVAYQEGQKIGEATRPTAGDPYRLQLTPDRNVIRADGEDLSYILIEALDAEGNLCPRADQQVRITLSGPGKIAGVGNGNPQSYHSFQADNVRLFNGRAMLILGAGQEAGEVSVVVRSGGLEDGETRVVVK